MMVRRSDGKTAGWTTTVRVILYSVGGLFLTVLPSSRLAAQGYPKTPPPPGPLTPVAFPPFHDEALPSGLRLLVVESHKQPIVSLSLSFAAGSLYDPAGKEGLADMVAGILTKGGGSRNAEQVADAIEGAGGSLGSAAGATVKVGEVIASRTSAYLTKLSVS